MNLIKIKSIIKAAIIAKADAVHPGYGFLSENVEFASRCEAEGITFVGPTTDALNLFGDKVQARALAKSIGVSVVDGSDESVDSSAEAKELAQKIGYPVKLKAAAGGGGRCSTTAAPAPSASASRSSRTSTRWPPPERCTAGWAAAAQR